MINQEGTDDVTLYIMATDLPHHGQNSGNIP